MKQLKLKKLFILFLFMLINVNLMTIYSYAIPKDFYKNKEHYSNITEDYISKYENLLELVLGEYEVKDKQQLSKSTSEISYDYYQWNIKYYDSDKKEQNCNIRNDLTIGYQIYKISFDKIENELKQKWKLNEAPLILYVGEESDCESYNFWYKNKDFCPKNITLDKALSSDKLYIRVYDENIKTRESADKFVEETFEKLNQTPNIFISQADVGYSNGQIYDIKENEFVLRLREKIDYKQLEETELENNIFIVTVFVVLVVVFLIIRKIIKNVKKR